MLVILGVTRLSCTMIGYTCISHTKTTWEVGLPGGYHHSFKISIYPQNLNIIMHILYAVIHTVLEMLRWGNLFYNRELLELVMVSFILEALMCNSGVIL